MQKSIFKMSLVAAAVALTACGGDVASITEQPSGFAVSGNAVKGPMHKAAVVAYKVNADGTKGDVLGSATTAADGSYSIPVTGYTGLVLVEVMATADTTMFDEGTGRSIAPPVGFTLRASVASPASGAAQGGNLSVQVNPLTEMAVAAAVARPGGLSVANVEAANAILRTVYGFSPTDDAPLFVNNVPQNKAASILYAISNAAKDNDFEVCAGATDAANKIKCVVEEMAKKGPQDAGVANALTLQLAVVAKLDGVPATAVPVIKTDVPPASAETTAVAQAKALLASLRSNAKALDASDLSLQTKLNEVNSSVQNSVAPVVESTFEMLRTMDFGVQLLEDAQNGTPVYRASRMGTPYGAGCTLYTDDTFAIPAVPPAAPTPAPKQVSEVVAVQVSEQPQAAAEVVAPSTAPVTVGCSSYQYVNRDVPDATTGVNNTWRWRHRVLIAPKAGSPGTYVVKTQARREYGTCEFSTGNCGTFTYTFAGTPDQAKPVTTDSYPNNSAYSVQRGEEGTAEFTRTIAGGSVTALNLTGTTAPSLLYRGLGVNPVLDNGNGRRHEVDLAVAKVTEGNVQKLVLSKDAFIKFFSRDKLGDPTVFRSSIGIGKDSYIQAPVVADAKDGTEAFKLSIGYVAGNSALRGSLEATNAVWDKSKTEYMPTKMVFGGRLETRATPTSEWADFLRGNLTIEAVNFAAFDSSKPVSSTNPQTMKATLNVAVTIPNRPVLAVKDMMIVGADMGQNNSSFTLSGQYVQGSLVVNVNGTAASNGGDSKVNLESSTGIKLDFDSSKAVHPMTKSGIKVGEYNSDTQRLNYVDGTFEQY